MQMLLSAVTLDVIAAADDVPLRRRSSAAAMSRASAEDSRIAAESAPAATGQVSDTSCGSLWAFLQQCHSCRPATLWVVLQLCRVAH